MGGLADFIPAWAAMGAARAGIFCRMKSFSQRLDWSCQDLSDSGLGSGLLRCFDGTGFRFHKSMISVGSRTQDWRGSSSLIANCRAIIA